MNGVYALTLVKPANAGDGNALPEMLDLWPSDLPPPIIVADMGYIEAERKKRLREHYRIPLITRVRVSMKPSQHFGLEPDGYPVCPWGQRLLYDHFDWESQHHLYLKPETCSACPSLTACPGEFWFSPEIHETYLGAQPLHTRLAQQLLRFARPLVEPGFSEDKNRLMLKSLFINSLALAEFASLLVDSAKLLKTLARLKHGHGKQLKKAPTQLCDQLKLPLFL